MSAWEAVSSTYVEAATAALPLQRIVVFAVGFIGSLAVTTQTHLSVLETVAKLELSKLTSLSTGPLAQASIGNVLIGFGLVALAWALSRSLLWTVFTLGAKSTDLWSRVDAVKLPKADQPFMEPAERQAAVALLDSSLLETRGRLRAMSAFAELLCGLSVGCSIGFVWGNALDLVSGLCLFAAALGLHTAAVRLFLSEYFGPALLRAQLQGRRAPTPLNAR